MTSLSALYRRFVSHMNPPVWLGSAALVIVFVALASLLPAQAERAFSAVQATITGTLGWFYLLVVTGLLVFALYLLLGPYGHVRLGPPDSRPDFAFWPWVSMMLAAGMGIGIVFFGVSEPLTHYFSPPSRVADTGQPAREALRLTFFHWGLHPWAIYSCLALPVAYEHFRHDLPLAPRSMLYPLLGERIRGWPGHVVDVLATVGTLFGVATSLGLGARQINAGLAQLLGIPDSTGIQVLLIGAITALATLSVVAGLKAGIRVLSTFNSALAAFMLLFVLVCGPTIHLLNTFVDAIGYYIQKLPATSLMTRPDEGDWQSNWTLFYWSWWISWSPFVGIFVARVSRGRTIREFLLAALLLPSVIGFLWFSVMAGTGISLLEGDAAQSVREAVDDGVKGSAFFAVLQQLPFAVVTQALAVLLIVLFFVTSSDSGSFVDDMVTSGGDPNPPVAQRIFWATAEGAVAATLLIGGGLVALRSASLITGLPMALLLICSSWAFLKQLRRDHRTDSAAASDR